MKKLISTALLCSFSILFCLFSCRKSPAPAPSPTSGDPIVGSWQIHDNQSATVAGKSTHDYVVTIARTGTTGTITMSNFAGETNATINANLSGNNFTIPQQNVNVGTNLGITGSGNFSGNTISYTYTMTRSPQYGGDANCTCTGTRK
jgi:hypothetical protein